MYLSLARRIFKGFAQDANYAQNADLRAESVNSLNDVKLLTEMALTRAGFKRDVLNPNSFTYKAKFTPAAVSALEDFLNSCGLRLETEQRGPITTAKVSQSLCFYWLQPVTLRWEA